MWLSFIERVNGSCSFEKNVSISRPKKIIIHAGPMVFSSAKGTPI
jgi:hypothetical protein